MDSLISPITSPNLNISGMDKVVNGEISGFPLNLSEIKVGNSILLDVLINTESHTTSSFSSNILTVSLSSPIEQQHSFKLKIDTPLQLPIDKNNQVTIKINAISPEKVAVKLISINNENPAKFITIPSLSPESSIQVPASNLSQTVLKPTEISYSTVTENPIIVDTTKSNSTISFHSLDLPKIIENISRQINLPETVISQITDGIKGAKIEVAFNTFVSKNITIDATDKPNPVYQTLSQLDIPVQNTIERLHVILNNFAEQLHDVTKPKPHLANVIEQIKNEIIPLKNFLMQGEAITKSDNSLVALKTVLGNILPDTLIKSENGTKAIIEIKNIFFPENKTNFSFNNLVSLWLNI